MTKYAYRRQYKGKRYRVAFHFVNTLSKRFISSNELLIYIMKLQNDFKPPKFKTCIHFIKTEYTITIDEIYDIYESAGYAIYKYNEQEITERYYSDFASLVYYNVTNLTSDPIRCRFS